MGFLYYTPQILEQAGVGVLLEGINISSDSASILISALTTLLVPCIGVAMRLMDLSGRRIRGVCVAICSLSFWIGDIIVTYSLPMMLNTIGLAGVFGIYAVVCCIALFLVYFRVPETKGLPPEVIIEFFNIGATGLHKTK